MDGLGRLATVEIGGTEARCSLTPEEWVAGVWLGSEGCRYTTAVAPERYVVLRAVDPGERALTFSGDVALLSPGAPLYFFNPDWKPLCFSEMTDV